MVPRKAALLCTSGSQVTFHFLVLGTVKILGSHPFAISKYRSSQSRCTSLHSTLLDRCSQDCRFQEICAALQPPATPEVLPAHRTAPDASSEARLVASPSRLALQMRNASSSRSPGLYIMGIVSSGLVKKEVSNHSRGHHYALQMKG